MLAEVLSGGGWVTIIFLLAMSFVTSCLFFQKRQEYLEELAEDVEELAEGFQTRYFIIFFYQGSESYFLTNFFLSLFFFFHRGVNYRVEIDEGWYSRFVNPKITLVITLQPGTLHDL